MTFWVQTFDHTQYILEARNMQFFYYNVGHDILFQFQHILKKPRNYKYKFLEEFMTYVFIQILHTA